MIKTVLFSAALAVSALSVPSFATPIVANGDFELDATDFHTYPGYVGQAGNPAQVTEFSGPTGGYGINPSGTGSAPFRDNGNDTTNVLFIQAGGTTLTNTITGFVAGYSYQLDFDYNARQCCGGTPGINVSIGGATTGNVVDPPVDPSGDFSDPYHHATLNFTATSGTETLSINKYDAVAGDSTALYDNFVITQTGTPEPASLSLLGFGAVGLLACRRRA